MWVQIQAKNFLAYVFSPLVLEPRYQDFSKHQFKNPTAVMNNFLEKIGYELKQKGQENNAKRTRFYELKIIERISLYASNREAFRDNFYVRDELFFLNKKDLSAYVN